MGEGNQCPSSRPSLPLGTTQCHHSHPRHSEQVDATTPVALSLGRKLLLFRARRPLPCRTHSDIIRRIRKEDDACFTVARNIYRGSPSCAGKRLFRFHRSRAAPLWNGLTLAHTDENDCRTLLRPVHRSCVGRRNTYVRCRSVRRKHRRHHCPHAFRSDWRRFACGNIFHKPVCLSDLRRNRRHPHILRSAH